MSPNVYIFDTDPEYSALLKGICRTTDLDSSVFNTPSEFLQQIPQHGILVVDIKMSFCDGLEIVKSLSNAGSRLKLIFMSSCDAGVLKGARQLAMANNLSVSACLRKPILVSSFRAALKQAACSLEQTGTEDLQELQYC